MKTFFSLSSFIFQSNWSAFAEFGLVGGNNFILKIANGDGNWKEVFTVDKNTGDIDFKQNILKNGQNLTIK